MLFALFGALLFEPLKIEEMKTELISHSGILWSPQETNQREAVYTNSSLVTDVSTLFIIDEDDSNVTTAISVAHIRSIICCSGKNF